ncbi:FAD/NAD(P)-binding oxidoreductase [Propionicimonas sp.]|uniref:NAD(P)/FAD-dependent oxidoreductase n=1 Tax=Propionicimonas sp. TaxID=1955623 RepID=UPI0017F38B6A|nr:FAD/NAD(P)-binding oxidoreductase [Propionicimonas sp.]MBU3975522.1 NAD(P)/FAD-dependent oxidoreductase [Actinomycetota bacterium]MBA3020073.1 NAD(P)/FAD-dependent oxidoreductase [Propionicimonas sp.]MBU3986329.1 NAD(P)/FAD-dependent oxidoreductase [Actinomycetota bacterium]MBU4007898.1 NAD(P)/FAD-dependent oxidoreductase [Actinomycetota bacterium]MBU4064156.1 NAD(P)/FAD-dependent oxidoreductase [Actinomycetota bacterium]
MANVVVLGAGIAGHTAALHLRRMLGRHHTVTVVSPNSNWNWIPSNIWVGVGKMPKTKVVFPLAPIYAKKGVDYRQAKAVAVYPQGDADDARGAVEIQYTGQDKAGQTEKIRYDYLVNATGPKLKFEATEGLGPDAGNTVSVCTADHAVEAAEKLAATIAKLKEGQPQTLVVGTGHGTCTCEGAAFEYTFNVDHELREAGVRDLATLYYLTNEAALGDFGVGGMIFNQGGFESTSELWTSSLFRERGVKPILGTHPHKITSSTITYETLDGEMHDLDYDFAMLLPPFGGHPIKAFDVAGNDITDQVFAPSGFMKVDADYTPKPYEEWRADDWPKTYQSVGYDNIWAVGIAFAPPHQISKPRKTPNGTVIAPAPPRTGMPSGLMAKIVAKTIVDRIQIGPKAVSHHVSMTEMGAVCVASAGTGLTRGSAAAMIMDPVVPDFTKYPTGRNLATTRGEIGLYGHWSKLMLHYLFIYKAKALPGWQLIPE